MSIQSSIITRDLDKISEKSGGNIYKAISVISKRARQISANVKDELNAKLADFTSTVDNLEEVFENREQIEISKFYEKLPKSVNISIEEFMDDKIKFRNRSEEIEELNADL